MGKRRLGSFAVAIPAQQSLDRKSVTKIVQARASAGIHSTQSNLSGQDVERPVDLAFVQPVAVSGLPRISLGAHAEALIPAFRVVGQTLQVEVCSGTQTGLSELGSPNRECLRTNPYPQVGG